MSPRDFSPKTGILLNNLSSAFCHCFIIDMTGIRELKCTQRNQLSNSMCRLEARVCWNCETATTSPWARDANKSNTHWTVFADLPLELRVCSHPTVECTPTPLLSPPPNYSYVCVVTAVSSSMAVAIQCLSADGAGVIVFPIRWLQLFCVFTMSKCYAYLVHVLIWIC